MKKLIPLLIVLFFFSEFFSQNVEFKKENFPNNPQEFADVLKKLELGTEYFNQGKKEMDDFRGRYILTNKYFPVSVHDYQKAGYKNFRLAYSLLNDADKFNPKNANVNYMLGLISFMTEPKSPESFYFLRTALSLSIPSESEAEYFLAWDHHLKMEWDTATKHYQNYLSALNQNPKINSYAIEDVRKKISECSIGKELVKNPLRVFVENLGPNINSPFPDYGAAITADEETIFFTSRRSNTTGGKRDISDGGFFEDVYTSTKVRGKWQESKPLSPNVNTDNHDAVSGLSPDGSRLYIFRSTPEDGGDLYESVVFGLDWEAPVKMNKNINTKFHENAVSISYDGRKLYFVSDKEKGFGAGDIYVSEIDIDGQWGISKNIGEEINTKYGEEAVFMHPDGVTMYFSSKGHNTMGGYDIFKSTFVNGKWSKPENLGYPINGPDDDVFFVVSGSGNRAYFASTKPDGYGDYDIYKITFLGIEKEPMLNSQDQLLAMAAKPVNNFKTEKTIELTSAKLTLIKGIVMDEKTEKPLEGTIELTDLVTNSLLATFNSNTSTGKYLLALPSGKNYGIAVKSKGYLFHSENFDLPKSLDFQEFNLDFPLKKIEVGSTVILNNIFFNFNEARLKKESVNELDRLSILLKENPTIKIEIGSYTDNVGSDNSNLKLSTQRSNNVMQYLIGKGIPDSRLVAKGYGKLKPIEKNNTENGRQKNRRTEFKNLSR